MPKMPRRARWRTLVVLAVVAGVAATACDAGGSAAGTDVVDVRAVEQAPAPPRDAELVDAGWPAAAAWIEREADAGRPVVVNIFASWCGPCRREMPLLLAAAETHPEVAFLGVDHQDLRDAGTEFVAELEVDIPTLYDPAGDIAVAVGARGMPTTAFFDASGRLVDTHTGELTESQLADALAALTA